jgi:hypothetical protein
MSAFGFYNIGCLSGGEIDQWQRRKAETEILMRILIAQLLAKVALWIPIQATQKY